MPQSTHNKTLLRVLLWWTAILSIIQAVFVVLFFTLGHVGQISSEPGVSADTAKMFTFKFVKVHSNNFITWYAVQSNDLPTDEGDLGSINIKKDGYFFMCLRITLSKCNEGEDKLTVTLVENEEPILVGRINKIACSTGVLCKMKRLMAGSSTLKVNISNNSVQIDEHLTVTYFDMLYIPN